MAEKNFLYVKPSLLDRLTAPVSGEYADGSHDAAGGGVREGIYRDSVLRDLEWLFNAVSPLAMEDEAIRKKYPHAANSVLGYGLRGVLGRVVENPADIRKQVLQSLRIFEPRLEIEDMKMEVSQEGQIIEIKITGFLLTQNASRSVYIRTDLTTLTSRLRTEADG